MNQWQGTGYTTSELFQQIRLSKCEGREKPLPDENSPEFWWRQWTDNEEGWDAVLLFENVAWKFHSFFSYSSHAVPLFFLSNVPMKSNEICLHFSTPNPIVVPEDGYAEVKRKIRIKDAIKVENESIFNLRNIRFIGKSKNHRYSLMLSWQKYSWMGWMFRNIRWFKFLRSLSEDLRSCTTQYDWDLSKLERIIYLKWT